MNEKQFKEAITAVQAQKKLDHPNYLIGLIRGLKHGFGKKDLKWLSLIDKTFKDAIKLGTKSGASGGVTIAEIGEGYRDGIAMAKMLTPKVGRPSERESGEPTIAFSIRLPQSVIEKIPTEKNKKRQWVQQLVETQIKQINQHIVVIQSELSKGDNCE